MNGSMIVLHTDGKITVQDYSDAVPLNVLQAAVGGYIEIVPGFDVYEFEGEWRPCVAYCNEDGKIIGLPKNDTATALWLGSHDVLVGDVVILVGDDEFLR